MDRNKFLSEFSSNNLKYDFLIIGGGATGIGIALEAAMRGYKTLLLEMSDFTKSTSSKSTKLIHGGVRYLAQGDLSLVRQACIERGRLLKNAPHLVKNQPFVIPTFGWFDELKFTAGLMFYDLLAGKYSLGRSYRISKKKTEEKIATINPQKITAGVVYHDGQFDDSRLAINVLQTAVKSGAHVINYMQVTSLTKDLNGKVNGVIARNLETGHEYSFGSRSVINATGVFADEILWMDNPDNSRTIVPSQGVHVVVDKKFLPGNYALMIPRTDDGRVLFAIPWHNHVVVGTTDTLVDKPTLEPIALDSEIDFILRTTGKYLTKVPTRRDILSIFAGLRPLAAPKSKGMKTKEVSRSHKILVTKSGLFSIIGGKWTTFRIMAEDTVNHVEKLKNWKKTRSKTQNLKIHGFTQKVNFNDPYYFYGTDKEKILQLAKNETGMDEVLSKQFNLIKAQVVWAVRYEMARTVEDVLSRRVRCLILDARECIKVAPQVASVMANELGHDETWIQAQITEFESLAKGYFLS
ncbi:MAG TPA: glycerol-3-phosphate dehydrogenase/oxidase [Bacteroidales bacterium]|nr:glycerol-3-phosphate dehydrogenase/oxidase [Bacteroidales bacterium]